MESSGAGAASGFIRLAPRPPLPVTRPTWAVVMPGQRHLEGNGDDRDLGRSRGAAESEGCSFACPAPGEWGGGVGRADGGGVMRMKASFKWKIKEVN